MPRQMMRNRVRTKSGVTHQVRGHPLADCGQPRECSPGARSAPFHPAVLPVPEYRAVNAPAVFTLTMLAR